MAQIVDYRQGMAYRSRELLEAPASLPPNTRVFVGSPTAPAGAALRNLLAQEGFGNVVAPEPRDLDLGDPSEARTFLRATRPEVAVLPVGTLAQAEDHGPVTPWNSWKVASRPSRP